MPEKVLLEWTEPEGARVYLAKVSGGLGRMFLRDLFIEGVPVFVFMLILWVFAYAAGAPVMEFWKSLVVVSIFAASIAALQFVLFFMNSRVRITATFVFLGTRRWRNRSIKSWSWETHNINSSYDVLTLTMKRFEVIRVALPVSITKIDVENALQAARISR